MKLSPNLLSLVQYQWISYWRRLRRAGSVSATNQGVLILILALVLVKYSQLLHVAAKNLSSGKTGLLTSLLLGIFIVWLFPLTAGNRAGLSSQSLLQLPISDIDLYLARVASLLVAPAAWLLVVASMGILYPISRSRNFLSGAAALIFYLVVAFQVGMAASALLGLAVWRKRIGLVVGLGVLTAVFVFREIPHELISEAGRFTPAVLVIKSALDQQPWWPLVVLALAAVIASMIAFWSFRLTLRSPNSRSRRTRVFSFIRLPGRLGGLVAKDLRYFARLLDVYFGVVASVLGCVHLIFSAEPSTEAVRLCVLLVFFSNSSLAFNQFGLDDRNAIQRYGLMPLDGKGTLLSKNLAFTVLTAAQLSPLLLITLLRLPATELIGTMIQIISLALAYLAWGNWMSIAMPIKLQFFRFSTSPAALADVIGGIFFGSLPGVVAIYLLSGGKIWLVFALLPLYVAVYIASLVRFGMRLDRKREQLASVLSN